MATLEEVKTLRDVWSERFANKAISERTNTGMLISLVAHAMKETLYEETYALVH